jgi:hypothetical protein
VTPGSSSRDGEIEAFVVDRYLDSLISREPHDASDVPAELRATAERLARDLPRYHPSFRFEEQLAARLATAADGRTGDLVDFPARVSTPAPAGAAARRIGGANDDRLVPVHPVVIGGVLTSAAISLAGAAWVAWRRGRPPIDPMTRAVRAVSRARVV